MIYFDNSATTQICEEALAAYNDVSLHHYGNPSSRHFYGGDAKKILEASRKEILSAIGGESTGTLLFGSCGSESNNLAIFGRAYAKERFSRGGKILTTAGEHAAVSLPLSRLLERGFRVSVIPTKNGVLDMDVLQKELTPDVILITMMMVNNETGAAYDIPAVAALLRKRKSVAPDAVLHLDATQAFMKRPIRISETGADMITLSAHKIEGPKGVSALYVSRELLKNHGLSPILLGGGQEEGLRGGTENLPGIAAFAAAVRYGKSHLPEYTQKTAALRQYLIDKLQTEPAFCEIHPVLPPVAAPHILSITLPHIKSETMLNALSARGICVSSGSACSSHNQHLSSALLAFGISPQDADCTIRVSLSHRNTREEADEFLEALAAEVGRLARIRTAR